MIGMAIFMRGLWAVSSLSRSEIEISGMEWQEGWEGGILYLRRAKVDTSGMADPFGMVGISQKKMNGNKLKPKSLNLNPFLCQPDPIGPVFGS